MAISQKDRLDQDLFIGDKIIVCYSRNGILSKAEIIGEMEKTWRIRVYYTDNGSSQDKTIDKNSRRIVKYA